MPTTEDDLRQILVDRTTAVPFPSSGPDRLSGVERRVRAIRRRRAALASGAVAVLVVGAVALVDPAATTTRVTTPPATRPADPAPPAKADELPEYAGGGRLVGVGRMDTRSQLTVSFTFTPRSWQLHTADRCTPPHNGIGTHLALSWRVNGRPFTAGSCGGGTAAGTTVAPEEFWRDLGVRLGQPSTVTVTMLGNLTDDQVGSSEAAKRPTRDVLVVAGVYERVPRERYPFPPRPATVPALDEMAEPLDPRGDVLAAVTARRVGANGRGTMTFVYRRGLSLRCSAVAPGLIDISAGGTLVDRFETWTYLQAGYVIGHAGDILEIGRFRAQQGQRVTLTVDARHFAEPDWACFVRKAP